MIVEWASGVNQRVMRASDWTFPVKVIEDTTRSGKPKRRMAHTFARKKISIVMKFKEEEYRQFITWFELELLSGANYFYFPRVDSSDSSDIGVYCISADSSVKGINESGKIIKVQMTWEEVR